MGKKQRKCFECSTKYTKYKRCCYNKLCKISKPYIENKEKAQKTIENTIKALIKKLEHQVAKEAKAETKAVMKKMKEKEYLDSRGIRALTSRWSDQYYYYTRAIYYEHYANVNPPFTQVDRIKKCEILNITNCKTCFLSGEKSKGVGDHLFEINGYAKFTNGKHGTYDEWNTLPVVGRLNKSYKKFKFENGNTKDVGYQNLTQEEFKDCSKSNQLIYIKIQKWKKYVISRNASLYWEITEKQSIWLDQKQKDYKQIVLKDVGEIKMLN